MMSAFAKKDKAKTTLKDKSICFSISKQNAITAKQYITDGFIDHLFYLFVTFYSRQPVTANGLSTCNSPSPHQSLSIVAGQLVEVYSSLSRIAPTVIDPSASTQAHSAFRKID
jgi:hypothetical protein